MLLTPHALVGGAIGASTDNLLYIIVLAILSHFVLDAVPHFDWGTWHNNKNFELETKDYLLVAGDIALLLIFTYFLWDNIKANPNIAVGGFFAILVDLIDNVPFWKDYVRKLPVFSQMHSLHRKIHFELKMKNWYWGVLTQIVIIIMAVIVIIK